MTGKIIVETAMFPGKGEVLLYFAFEDNFKKDQNLKLLNEKLQGKIEKKIKQFDFNGKNGQMISWETGGFYEHIFLVGLGNIKDFKRSVFKNVLADVIRRIDTIKANSLNLFYFSQLGKDFFELGKNLALSFYLANYSFNKYKGEEEKKQTNKIREINFYLEEKQISNINKSELEKGISLGKLISEGVYLTRDLVNEPGAYTHPDTLEQVAFEIEKESRGKIKVEVMDEDECRRLGMGAYLGVAQGSEKKPKFIILKYKSLTFNLPRRQAGVKRSTFKSICLIGKSITFDSGGLSLKPSEAMESMKIDMAGGATVLGVFKILAKLELEKMGLNINTDIYGILPACENMPSGKALRPGDILKALNGKTIEVLNTDAEGRLALADALVYAEKYLKADMIIDLATLTGACVVALGNDLTGLFGNDEKLIKGFKEICEREDDQLWQLPLYKPYLKKMKSEVADLKNVSGGRYGGAITAALFLSEFVKTAKWLHLDIAGPAFNIDETKGVIGKGGTGWGVTSLVTYLVESL